MIGSRVKRREDARLLVGRGQYIGDIVLPGMVHAALLRSPYAHARIISVDAREALEVPGVLAVVTGAELKAKMGPMASHFDNIGKYAPTRAHDYPMAVAKVRYMGEPVAAVVANVNDVAASQLMISFYRHLAEPGTSRAQALAHAQRELLADSRTRHPAY